MTMKRRGFIAAIFGGLAACFAPKRKALVLGVDPGAGDATAIRLIYREDNEMFYVVRDTPPVSSLPRGPGSLFNPARNVHADWELARKKLGLPEYRRGKAALSPKGKHG